MATRWQLEVAHVTDPGRVRSNNEDCLAVDRERRYAVLADGMGGHNAGEVASRIAVTVVAAALRDGSAPCARDDSPADIERLLREHVLAANAAIYRDAETHPGHSGMGTTIVAALWHAGGVSAAHVGDSRLYRLRGATLEQLTRDHSVVQEQIELGLVTREAARRSPARNLVTRALGLAPQVEVDVQTHDTRAGDIFLLCSDGLTDMVEDVEIAGILGAEGGSASAARGLVERANARGGRDNVSVVVVRVVAAAAA